MFKDGEINYTYRMIIKLDIEKKKYQKKLTNVELIFPFPCLSIFRLS